MGARRPAWRHPSRKFANAFLPCRSRFAIAYLRIVLEATMRTLQSRRLIGLGGFPMTLPSKINNPDGRCIDVLEDIETSTDELIVLTTTTTTSPGRLENLLFFPNHNSSGSRNGQEENRS